MRLGIAVGTNSIGWWLYETRNGRITSVLDGGVRIFSDGRDPKSGTSLAVDRRTARSMRRRRDRYLRRRASLMRRLKESGLMPNDPAEAKELENLDPYALRAQALDHALPLSHLGRAVFHLNQRRGFRSNRKADRRDNESELIRLAVARLDQAIMMSGARTYGEFLHLRRQQVSDDNRTLPVRTRLTTALREGEEKETAGYEYFPDRRHLSEEFEKIWAAQARHHPGVLTDDLRKAVFQTIFHQRPLKTPAVGRCLFTDERRLPKAHPLAARKVLYETVNALRVKAPGKASRPLSRDERELIVHALNGKKHAKSISSMSIKLKKLGRVIDLAPEETVTSETGNHDAVDCDRVRASLSHPDRFGHRWIGMDSEEQWEVVDKLRTEEDQDILIDWLVARFDLDRRHAEKISGAPLPEGYSRLGETATRRILEMLESDVLTHGEAVKACGWHHSDLRTGEVMDELPYYGAVLNRHVIPGTQDPRHDDITRYGRIANPTFHIGLNQLRRLVNRIIRVHGKPDQVVVELARELKQSAKQRLQAQRRLKETTAAAIRRGKRLEELGISNSGVNRMILRLWEDLGHDPMMRKCPYSGRHISTAMLFDGSCDAGHILPYSRTLDDNPANRTLCLKEANRTKRNQTPWEAWGGTEQWDEITANLKNLPKNKQWRFAPDAMTRFEQKRDFLDRNLVDTQYLSRVAKTYLDTLYAEGEQHVWVIPGRLTEMFRRHWGLNSLLTDQGKDTNKAKNRTDHRHHAIDAAVIAATDRSLLKRVSDAASLFEVQGAEKVVRTTDPPWKGFREEIGAQLEKIVVSHRADHGRIDHSARMDGQDSTSGKLHNDTAYGLIGDSQNGVPLVVSRKPLDALNPANLGKIRDPQLKRSLKTATLGKTGKDFKEVLSDFARTSSRYRGMRRVRMVETVKVIEMRDRAGRVYKGYKPDSNHCYEVWELPTGEWVPLVLTTFDANRGQIPLKPHPAARRIMRLYKKDMLYLSHPTRGNVIATVEQLSIQRLNLVPHNEANADARNRDSADPFSFIRVGIGTLKRSRARRVYVDEMGRLRDPGPPRI